MKIKSILITLILLMAVFTGLSAFIQDRLSKNLIEQANTTQMELIKTSALVDEVRMLQITFKWQVQAFKDVILRGREPDLLEKYHHEYTSNLDKVTASIEGISRKLQDSEFAAISQTAKQLAEKHKAVSAKYSEAIELYAKLIKEKHGNDGLAADVAVRGIDRELTADIDKIALFARQLNEANSAAAANAVLKMHTEISTKIYAVGGVLTLILVIAGIYAARLIMSVLGAEPVLLRQVAENISRGDLTNSIPSHNLDDESSLAAQLLLMQMKVRSLVVGIREETKGALDRARSGAHIDNIIDDMRALSKSMRKFKTSANEEPL